MLARVSVPADARMIALRPLPAANLTYDLKIVRPDGGLYDATDLTEMEALKGKVPMRFSIFDNRSFIKVRFEPHDPSGTYRIVAAINDNVGRKRVPLTAEVKLTD